MATLPRIGLSPFPHDVDYSHCTNNQYGPANSYVNQSPYIEPPGSEYKPTCYPAPPKEIPTYICVPRKRGKLKATVKHMYENKWVRRAIKVGLIVTCLGCAAEIANAVLGADGMFDGTNAGAGLDAGANLNPNLDPNHGVNMLKPAEQIMAVGNAQAFWGPLNNVSSLSAVK